MTLAVSIFAQRPTAPLDEWKALDISLSQKSMKPIRPRNGFVPDEATAVKVALAVAVAQWGEKAIAEELPFKGRLRGDVWTVKGTLHPQGAAGGTAVIKVSKSTGAILFAVHQY
ncbi:MAG: NTF2 fold immunity protein [Terracidiphilus sp.]|nr:NTF2 fold immunity protein [Terracidiphilus sp.]